MSTSIDYVDCPCCGEKGTLFREFNCRTTEDEHFCMACGYTYSYHFQRDEKGELVRKPTEYNLKDCIFGIRDYDTMKLVHQIPMDTVENISEKMIEDWINYLPSLRKPDDNAPEGSRNIFYMEGETPHQLFYIGNFLTVNKEKNLLIVHEAHVEEEINQGHGVIVIARNNNGTIFQNVPANKTKEEVLKDIEELRDKHLDEIKYIKATWYNNDTKKLEVLVEELKENNLPDNQDPMEMAIHNIPF